MEAKDRTKELDVRVKVVRAGTQSCCARRMRPADIAVEAAILLRGVALGVVAMKEDRHQSLLT